MNLILQEHLQCYKGKQIEHAFCCNFLIQSKSCKQSYRIFHPIQVCLLY